MSLLLSTLHKSFYDFSLCLSYQRVIAISRSRLFSVMSNNKRVFVCRSDIPKEALELLEKEFEVDVWSDVILPREYLLKKVKGVNGLFCCVCDKIDDEVFEAAGPELKVISTVSVGVDHIDLEACKRRGIIIGHTPGVLTDAVAELCVGLLLATSRRLMEASREVTNGGWQAWNLMYMTGSQLKDSTVGIVGLGRIGFAIAKRIKSFNVKQIIYCTAGRVKPYAAEIGAEFVTFEELLQRSDFIIISAALTPETKGLFNAKAFNQMKTNAILINVSRGLLVDQDALLEALTSRRIKAAGLDVTTPEPLPTDHPLTKLDNCVILPHIGSATVATRTEMAVLTAKNLIAGLKGEKMPARLE